MYPTSESNANRFDECNTCAVVEQELSSVFFFLLFGRKVANTIENIQYIMN